MKPGAQNSLRLLRMDVRFEQDVVQCRLRARQFAEVLGFPPQAQIRLATALSEIARNAFQYAGGGKVEFLFEIEPRPGMNRVQQSLVIVVRDSGPGIAALEAILGGEYRSRTGLGVGLLGAKRLMDRLDIETSKDGTTVTMRQILPPGLTLRKPREIQAAVDEILRRPPASALEEMQLQNQELIRVANEARAKEEEIRRINEELAETNQGVLALYDELETLHRVSLLLASKLELKALIESIINVTTELAEADLGAFFFWNEPAGAWTLYATAGKAAGALDGMEPVADAHFFGEDFVKGALSRSGDLASEPAPAPGAKFARALEGRLEVRSCLMAPLVDSNSAAVGAMVFASAQANRFSERSERIVASVAAQAVTGIEKSRLFQEVKATSEAKDQFLAMLSHELRTPLNPVMAIVSSWHGDPRVPLEMREEISIIARNIRLETRLIDDLLDFNRMINGKLKLDCEHVDIHGVIESVTDICRADLDIAGQFLEITLGATSYHVAGDAARLQQVFWNVLKNAIKFTGRAGHITIHTSNPAPESIRVTIRDNGRGIEPEDLGRIFGAFEQGQPQVLARYGGLGLGLAISKTFVERHGGTIVALSAGLDQGAEFVIELPLTSEEPALPAPLPPPAAGHLPGKAAAILLIEDHADTLSTLSRLLLKKGYTVVAAKNGAGAREAFAAGQFDVIISDLGLPDCSGLELMSEFRSQRATPAIALSGYGMEADVRNCFAAGFTSHLTKPIDFGDLLSAVNHLTAQSQESR